MAEVADGNRRPVSETTIFPPDMRWDMYRTFLGMAVFVLSELLPFRDPASVAYTVLWVFQGVMCLVVLHNAFRFVIRSMIRREELKEPYRP